MSTPAWILGTFAAVMILVAEVSAGQLVMARAWTRPAGADLAGSYLLMGIALAGVLMPGLRILPDAVWAVVFAVMTAWFAWCLWRESRRHGTAAVARGHYAPLLARSAAMLYIFAARMTWGSSGGIPALHAPALALIFALLLIAFTVHDLDRRPGVDGYFQVAGRRPGPGGSAPAAAAAGPVALLLSSAVVKGCRVATGVTMAFILIIMI